MPTQKRLKTDEMTFLQRDDGLIINLHFSVSFGTLEVNLEGREAQGFLAHGPCKELITRPAERLGMVHGDVSVTNDFRCTARTHLAHSDTSAKRHINGLCTDNKRFSYFVANTQRTVHGMFARNGRVE